MNFIQPSIDPVIFSLSIIEIRWYSLSYIVGLILGIIVIKKLNKYKGSLISDNQIETKCLRPDAFVKMGECTFSVEIDANTEDKTQLRDKLAKYILFLNKKDNREIRVLFIATHFQRTKMIFSLLQEILQKLPANSTEQIANRIYFSCLEFLENGFIHGWVSANTKKDITKSDFVSGIAN